MTDEITRLVAELKQARESFEGMDDTWAEMLVKCRERAEAAEATLTTVTQERDALRNKLDEAYERAAQECEQQDSDGDGPDCWGWHQKDYAAAIRALKTEA